MFLPSLVFKVLVIILLTVGCRPAFIGVKPSPDIVADATEIPQSDQLLEGILQSHPQLFDSILKNKEKFRASIIYTRIDRDERGEPSFRHFQMDVDTGRYFYPASTIKLPLAGMALQRLNEINIPELDRNSIMVTGTEYSWQTAVYNAPNSPTGSPTISHYIDKIFSVSDNDASNRLYEFLGQEYIHETLKKMGYPGARILHRLSIGLTDEQNRITNPVKFFDSWGKELCAQAGRRNENLYPGKPIFMGNGFMSGGKLVESPFDFSTKNIFTLPDLHSILISLLFPLSVPPHQRFNLRNDDHRFLLGSMSSKISKDGMDYGPKDPGPDSRKFSKIGGAYGFLTDVTYIADPDNKVEFFLTATIFCNNNGIFNDDRYEYNTIGYPFLKNLERAIFMDEIQREKKFLPDLEWVRALGKDQ
jgi:hypothetical protein